MKRTLVLVALAAAATWAFLFFPLAGKRAERVPGAPRAAQPATPAASPPVPRASSASTASPPREAAPEVPSRTAPPRPAASAPAAPPSGRGDVAVIGGQGPRAAAAHGDSLEAPALSALEADRGAATGELGEGILSPDYRQLEESYVNEPRDGPWAQAHEQKIREALYASELHGRIVIVHCQSTVCRLQMQPQGDDPLGELLRVPGLAEATGLDSSTPYSLNGSELIVYARPESAAPTPR